MPTGWAGVVADQTQLTLVFLIQPSAEFVATLEARMDQYTPDPLFLEKREAVERRALIEEIDQVASMADVRLYLKRLRGLTP